MRSQTGAYWNKGGFLPFLLLGAGGPASGIVFRLKHGPATIGRDPANSLPLNDPVLSRRHCRIEIRNGQPVLEDLGSFNGTLVNGARVERACLRHEDEIRAGASLFRVVDLRLDSGSSPSCASGEAEKILQTMELPGGAAAPFPLEPKFVTACAFLAILGLLGAVSNCFFKRRSRKARCSADLPS